MKRLHYIFFLAFLAVAVPAIAVGDPARQQVSKVERHLNDILQRVRARAIEVSAHYPDFEAGIYLQSNVEVLKRGKGVRHLPHLKNLQRGEDSYEGEFIGSITFTNPNIYNHSVYPISREKSRFLEGHIDYVVSPLARMNVYSQNILQGLYSPIAYKSGKYYWFRMLNFWQKGEHTLFRISFRPKFASYKFVEGEMVVSSEDWGIRDISFKGEMELIRYSIDVEMGQEGTREGILPKNVVVSTDANLLGTRLKGRYSAAFRYDTVSVSHLETGVGAGKYNLSTLYGTQEDTLKALVSSIKSFRDTAAVARNTGAGQQNNQGHLNTPGQQGAQQPHEHHIAALLDTLSAPVKLRKGTLARMGRFFTNDYSLEIKNVGELDIPPLVSPILFDFSTSNGISYTQRLKFTRVTAKDKLFLLEPRVGYNFKYKEFYWGVKGEVNYAPRKMSRIFIDIGNGTKVTTERIRDDLFSLPMPIFDSTSINLRDFKTNYARIGHKIEIANGLTLGTNLAFMRYSEDGYSDFTLKYPDSQFVSQAQKIASHRYITFVPELELTYTPHQYYYMNGERKTYLYSRYPTFHLTLSHAIKGVLNSTTRYNKIELDMHQKLKVGPMHEFFYRAGAGLFYDYTDLYFAEFNNLRRNNLPEGWNDDIGGTFHLLPRFRYNEIDKYLRANIKYDAPMLLASSLLRSVKYITKERLYCNLLLVDTMDPYIEMGYGIGTHIFNVGVFWGGEITRWNLVGVKFTFEIFN